MIDQLNQRDGKILFAVTMLVIGGVFMYAGYSIHQGANPVLMVAFAFVWAVIGVISLVTTLRDIANGNVRDI